MEFNEILKKDDQFRYQMLNRLQMDCEYFFGFGQRNPKVLWAKDMEQQIELMKALWNSFPADQKPEWLSLEEIKAYERRGRKDHAKETAEILCTTYCFCGYNCGKPHGQGILKVQTLLGDGTKCPLAKYGITPQPPKSLLNGYKSPSVDDLWDLCADCEHSRLRADQGQLIIDLSEFETKCIDCPVQQTREDILEAEAEANMS